MRDLRIVLLAVLLLAVVAMLLAGCPKKAVPNDQAKSQMPEELKAKMKGGTMTPPSQKGGGMAPGGGSAPPAPSGS